MISLVDVKRQWFKSKVGVTVCETHRDHAFCTYVVLEDSPDVFVVPDATQDDRFKNNPLVTGPPHIRFYAGSAIVVNEQKIGSFCIIDTVPHLDFDLEQKRNLLDLEACVSQLIQERKSDRTDVDREKATMVVAATKSIQLSLALSLSSLKSLKAMLNASKDDVEVFDNLDILRSQIMEFEYAIHHVGNVIEVVLAATSYLLRDASSDFQTNCLREVSCIGNTVEIDVVGEIEKLVQNLQLFLPSMELVVTFDEGEWMKYEHKIKFECLAFLLCLSISFSSSTMQKVDITMRVKENRNKSYHYLVVNLTYTPKDNDSKEGSLPIIFNMQKLLINSIMKISNGTVVCKKKTNFQFKIPFQLGEKKIQNSLMTLNMYQAIISLLYKPNKVKHKYKYGVVNHYEDIDHVRKATHTGKFILNTFHSYCDVTNSNELGDEMKSCSRSGYSSRKDSNSRVLTVLIIEDTLPVQKLLSKLLTSMGCNVSVAENGLVGLEMMKTTSFDLVITDFLMVSFYCTIICMKTNQRIVLFLVLKCII